MQTQHQWAQNSQADKDKTALGPVGLLRPENNVHIIKSQQTWLSNLEVLSGNEAQISWNSVTKPHFHYISNNQLFSVNVAFLSLPYHGSKLPQSFQHVIKAPAQH